MTVILPVTMNGKEYKVSSETGLHYSPETDAIVIAKIDWAYRSKNRIRIYLGDKDTGRVWLEEYHIIGTVSATTGIKSPILINNSRSIGGGLISTNSILAIQDVKTKSFLYKHNNFKLPNLWIGGATISLKEQGFTTMVYHLSSKGTENVANFKTEEQAKRYIAFMKGERMSK